MNKKMCVLAFVLGLVGISWVGLGYIGSSPLALLMTFVIGAAYVAGALELFRFHQATSRLIHALAAIPEGLSHLGEWLNQIPLSLQNPVRLRIEGERVGLPGPAMTPYLVGLLVLLGMLGTFLGMVVTLNGAVIALESTTDLQTIRASLAAPVKGLGVAFGTSIAGVAASAMLGLISAFCRRERLQAAQGLDSKIATVLRDFSLTHQRQETFKALQFQAKALPQVVDQLQAMMVQMERQQAQVNDRLLAGQEGFYREAKGVYSDLAVSVDRSLKESLRESARLAGETIQPAVAATMSRIAQETRVLQEQLTQTVNRQLEGMSSRFESTVATVNENWAAALAHHERTTERLNQGLQASLAAYTETFSQRSAALLNSVESAHLGLRTDLSSEMHTSHAAFAETFTQRTTGLLSALQESHALGQAESAARDEARLRVMNQSLEAMSASLLAEWKTAGAHTIDEVTRLMQHAAEAPRAAAEVISQLRHELSASMARDNTLLEERSRIMETLSALLSAINHASNEQRGAIDALVNSSASMLDRVGTQFSTKIETEAAKMVDIAAQVSGGAVEVASLSESFGLAVQLFSESNEKLMSALQRIEISLGKSMVRSDEQLAYYVAQAREIIDLSIMSQKQIVDDLQQFTAQPLALVTEV